MPEYYTLLKTKSTDKQNLYCIDIAHSPWAVRYAGDISVEGKSLLNECSGYKPSGGEAPILKQWRMSSAPSLRLLLGPL